MAKPYIVRSGDYAAKIAAERGCSEDELWGLPTNQALREASRDRNVLCPGDVLQVPEPRAVPLALTLGAHNPYAARLPVVPVRLRFHGPEGPLASAAYEVDIAGAITRGTSTGDGQVEFEVPVHVTEVVVRFPARRDIYRIAVGRLDPPSERSGAVARLRQLGFLVAADAIEVDDDALRLALVGFQRARGLDLTGELDPDTVARLTEAFGC